MPERADPARRPVRAVPLDEARRARGEAKVAVSRSKVVSARPFRRIRADRLFGIIGIIVIALSSWLVISWEKPIRPEPSVDVDWPISVANVTLQDAQVSIGRDDDSRVATREFEVLGPNITQVAVLLTTRDETGTSLPEFDILRYTLAGPQGSEFNFTRIVPTNSTESTFSILLDVAPVPSINSVRAANAQEALAALGDQSNETGVGGWVLTIELVDVRDHYESEELRAQNQPCPSNLPNVCTRDTGQVIAVAVSYTTYASSFPGP